MLTMYTLTEVYDLTTHRISEENEKRMRRAMRELVQQKISSDGGYTEQEIKGWTFDEVLGLILQKAGF